MLDMVGIAMYGCCHVPTPNHPTIQLSLTTNLKNITNISSLLKRCHFQKHHSLKTNGHQSSSVPTSPGWLVSGRILFTYLFTTKVHIHICHLEQPSRLVHQPILRWHVRTPSSDGCKAPRLLQVHRLGGRCSEEAATVCRNDVTNELLYPARDRFIYIAGFYPP